MYARRHVATVTFISLCVALPALAGAAPFLPWQAIPTGSWPEAVAVGDVTGDGLNDVVLTTSYYFEPEKDYKLMVFVQTPDGALAPPVLYATAGTYTERPASVAVGDLNGDGRKDVVVGNGGASIQIYSQTVDGTLAAPALIPTAFSDRVRVADLNGDGRDDVAGIGWGSSEAGVFLQGADGVVAFYGAYSAPHGGYDDLELADVSGDGLVDIVVMSGQGYAYDNLAVLRQVAGGFAPTAPYDLGGDELTQGVGVGDVNGDGRNDVVVSYGGNRPNANIAQFPQQAGGALGLPLSMASYDCPESLDVADVTDDGRDDVLVLHGGWSALGVYPQQSGALGTEQLVTIPYASHYNPHGLAVGDINGDGRPDVVIADYNNGLVYLLNATPNFAPVADAGNNRAVYSGRTVRLDGTASTDSDGIIVKYNWRQVSGPVVTLTRAGPGVVIFTAPGVEAETRLVFQLKVTDDDGATATDRVVIRVKPTAS